MHVEEDHTSMHNVSAYHDERKSPIAESATSSITFGFVLANELFHTVTVKTSQTGRLESSQGK